jgi:hypothetical protein
MSTKSEGYSDDEENERIRQIGEKIFRLKFDKVERAGSEANFIGIKSKSILFSTRLDSRTYFVQDLRYGVGKERGVYHGPDGVQLNMCKALLKRVAIPSSEIAGHKVLTEKSREARLERGTGKMKFEEERKQRSLVLISRKIEGFPVWDSSVLMGLTRDKQVGFLQLHWPEIPEHVVAEAHKLASRIKEGWHPPRDESSNVESVEAGIIHSPAIGFVMDIFPAIRVVYKSKDKRYGKRKVLYLDRHGRSVPLPRQADMPYSPPVQRAPTEGRSGR